MFVWCKTMGIWRLLWCWMVSESEEYKNFLSHTHKLNETLCVSAKVSPFYEAQELVASVFSITNNRMPQPGDWGRIQRVLADVRVQVMFARHRSFGIGRFTDKPMTELM